MQLKLDLEVRSLSTVPDVKEGYGVKGTIDVDFGEIGTMLGQVLTAILAEITKQKSVPPRRT